MSKKTIEAIAQGLLPSNSHDNPAFPNYTDNDIWIAGFKAGFKEFLEEFETFYVLNQIEIHRNPEDELESFINDMNNFLNNG